MKVRPRGDFIVLLHWETRDNHHQNMNNMWVGVVVRLSRYSAIHSLSCPSKRRQKRERERGGRETGRDRDGGEREREREEERGRERRREGKGARERA